METPDLRQLQSVFENHFNCSLIHDADIKIEDQLIVDLPNDANERPRQCEFLILPDEDGLCYLQYFSAMNFGYNPELNSETTRLIAYINAILPLIGFGFSEELEMLYYRCVVPCPNKPFDQEIHLHNVFVLIYLLDNFSFFIEAISNGLKTFEECCNEIKRIKHIE